MRYMLKIPAGSSANIDYSCYASHNSNYFGQDAVFLEEDLSEGYNLANHLFCEEDDTSLDRSSQFLLEEIKYEINSRMSFPRTIGNLLHCVAKIALDKFWKTDGGSCLLHEEEIPVLMNCTEEDCVEEVSDANCLITKDFVSDKLELYECEIRLEATLMQVKSCPESEFIWKLLNDQGENVRYVCRHKSLERLFVHHIPVHMIELSTINDVTLRTLIFQMNVMLDDLMPTRIEKMCEFSTKNDFLNFINILNSRFEKSTLKIIQACIQSGHFLPNVLTKNAFGQDSELALRDEQGQRTYYGGAWDYKCIKLKANYLRLSHK